MIDIYNPIIIRDIFGAEVETYTVVAGHVRAHIEKFNENRQDTGYEVDYNIIRTFIIRRNYKNFLSEKSRILYSEVYYQVISVDNAIDNNNITVKAQKIK
jgi:hypothetical protein